MITLLDKDGRDISNQRLYCSQPGCLGEPWCSAWGICKQQQEASGEISGGSGCYDEDNNKYDDLFLELSQQDMCPTSHFPIPPSPTPIPSFLPVSHNPQLQGSSSTLLPNITTVPTMSTNKAAKRQFSAIKTDREIELARNAGVPKSTQTDTKYCVGLWEAWVDYRRSVNEDCIGQLSALSKEELKSLAYPIYFGGI